MPVEKGEAMNYIHGTEARSVKPKQRLYEFTVDKHTGALYLEQKKPEIWLELPYISLLAVAVLFAILSCCNFIRLTTDAHYRVQNISSLQSDYYSLYTGNELLEKELQQITNLSNIYAIAVGELGMVPVDEEHVILYERTNSEYVYQTENIPTIGYTR
jgi:hypothetical protein